MAASPASASTRGPLAAYRILDLCDLKGALGPKLLAEYGADVIRVEPPGGHPMRNLPPFAGKTPDPERGLVHLYRNLGKRGITLNIESPSGREILERLIATADVLYESFDPGYLASLDLAWPRLRALNPRLVHVSITEYGEEGPRAGWKGSPITSFAMSGAMQVAGWPDRPPCDAPHPMAYDSAVAYANVAVMMALWSRHTSNEGQHIEVSVQEAGIGGLYPWAVPTYTYGGMGAAIPPLATRGGVVSTLFACRDGYVRMTITMERHWAALLAALGNPQELSNPEWQEQSFRIANTDLLHELIEQHTRLYDMEEFLTHAQQYGVPLAAVRTPSGFMADPNTRVRGFWVEVDHPVAGRAEYPGVALRMSRSETAIQRLAPRIGEHNAEVFAELGLDPETVTAPAAASPV